VLAQVTPLGPEPAPGRRKPDERPVLLWQRRDHRWPNQVQPARRQRIRRRHPLLLTRHEGGTGSYRPDDLQFRYMGINVSSSGVYGWIS
jgi:hypothetical protein